jgi:hypothetical protein
MQIGKAGSYVWARACPAAETIPIAKIAKARMRIGTSFEFGTISAHILISVNSRSCASLRCLNLTQDAFAHSRANVN